MERSIKKAPARPAVEWDESASPVHVLHGTILQMQRTLDQVQKLAIRNDRRLRTLMGLLHQKAASLSSDGGGSVGFAPTGTATADSNAASDKRRSAGAAATPAPAGLGESVSRPEAGMSVSSTAASGAVDPTPTGLTAQPPNLEFLTLLTTGSDGARGLSAMFPGIEGSGSSSGSSGMGLLTGSAVPSELLPQQLAGQGRSLSHLLSRHASDVIDVGVLFDQSHKRHASSAPAQRDQHAETKRSRQG